MGNKKERIKSTAPRQLHHGHTSITPPTKMNDSKIQAEADSDSSIEFIGDFGDFGVSFVATVAGRYTRRGLSVQGESLLVPTRDNHEVPSMQRRPTVGERKTIISSD